MKRVILCKGLPSSGKSVWAKELQESNPGAYKVVEKDRLREMLDNGRWSGANEKFILRLRDHIVIEALNEGKSVILSDTNLHPKHEIRIRQLLQGRKDVKVEVQDFTGVPVEVCIERDLRRPNSVGSKVIHKMYSEYILPQTRKPLDFTRDSSKTPAIIVDLDGTYALFGNERSPYASDKVESDKVNPVVNMIVSAVADQPDGPGPDVLLVSGRKEEHREFTERWLEKNKIAYSRLLLRPAGDNQKDTVVKKEIYDKYIKKDYDILFVLDDRPSTLKLWKDLGLYTLGVNQDPELIDF